MLCVVLCVVCRVAWGLGSCVMAGVDGFRTRCAVFPVPDDWIKRPASRHHGFGRTSRFAGARKADAVPGPGAYMQRAQTAVGSQRRSASSNDLLGLTSPISRPGTSAAIRAARGGSRASSGDGDDNDRDDDGDDNNNDEDDDEYGSGSDDGGNEADGTPPLTAARSTGSKHRGRGSRANAPPADRYQQKYGKLSYSGGVYRCVSSLRAPHALLASSFLLCRAVLCCCDCAGNLAGPRR